MWIESGAGAARPSRGRRRTGIRSRPHRFPFSEPAPESRPHRLLRSGQAGLLLAAGQDLLHRAAHVEHRELVRSLRRASPAEALPSTAESGFAVGVTTTPYARAPAAVTSPRRTSLATSAGSRSSGSPHPPPPQVTKCSTSSGRTGTSWHLLGSTSREPSARSIHLGAAGAGRAAVDAPRIHQPAVVVDGDRAGLEEAVGHVDAVAAAVQAGRRRCRRPSPTSRCAEGSTTPGTRTGCSRSSATTSDRRARRRAAAPGYRRSRSSTAGTTRPCGHPPE